MRHVLTSRLAPLHINKSKSAGRDEAAMREIRASEAREHLPRLLDAVEGGETVVITRHGKPIARLVPETEPSQAHRDQTHEAILALRKSMPRLSLDDILAARHDGHKY